MNEFTEWIAGAIEGAHWAIQFAAVFAVGTIPFLESYVGAALGVVVAMPWPVALFGAVAGTLAAVALAVALAGRARRTWSRGREPSPRQQKIIARVEKWGIPAASLLAPTLFAISLTSFAMVAAGLNSRTVLIWNGVSALVWGAATMGLVGTALGTLA